jgi:20S proteasome alpha/beta subunit
MHSIVWWLCFLETWLCVISVSDFNNDGRYSYSLSFFDPNGSLGQVERAVQAASSGIPILVLTRDDHIFMAAPHVLPTALTTIGDGGTQRFARVTSSIGMAHSGITADGRVLMTAAQRLALEHEYVFDEDIPMAVFLEEMSLLFQEYTMKEGVRPFGACLIVASLSGLNDDDKNKGEAASAPPQVYRIDPSGSVSALGLQEQYFCPRGSEMSRQYLATRAGEG